MKFQILNRRCTLNYREGRANSQKKLVPERRVFSGFCEWDGEEALAALLFGCPSIWVANV